MTQVSSRELMVRLLNVPAELERLFTEVKRFYPPFPEHGATAFIWHTFRITGFPFPGYHVPYAPHPLQLTNQLLVRGWVLWEDKPHIGDIYVVEGKEPGTVDDTGFVVGTGGLEREEPYFLGVNHRGSRSFRKKLEEVTYFLFI